MDLSNYKCYKCGITQKPIVFEITTNYASQRQFKVICPGKFISGCAHVGPAFVFAEDALKYGVPLFIAMNELEVSKRNKNE